MQNSVHAQETARPCRRRGRRLRLAKCGRTYIAISREAGTDAGEVARLLGQKLGWEVLDRASWTAWPSGSMSPARMLDLVDETHSNWADDALGPASTADRHARKYVAV